MQPANARQLGAATSRVPVIIITGNSQPDMRKLCLGAGRRPIC